MREGAAGGSGEGAGREGGGGWHGSSLPLSSLCVTGTVFRGFRINERIEASGVPPYPRTLAPPYPRTPRTPVPSYPSHPRTLVPLVPSYPHTP